MKERDRLVLKKIVKYCDDINTTKNRLGDSYEIFSDDFIYQNACCMCILQIGELTGKLSDELKNFYSFIPWKQIKNMRNILAHDYGSLDCKMAWETINNDIPSLKEICQGIFDNLDLLIEINKSSGVEYVSKHSNSKTLYAAYAKEILKDAAGHWNNDLDYKIAKKMIIDGFEEYQVNCALKYSVNKDIKPREITKNLLKDKDVIKAINDKDRGR